MNLTRTSWPRGWNPSADPTNGDPSSLLRMDNLRLNEEGVLALARGAQKLNSVSFSQDPFRIYSKTINSTDFKWVALDSTGIAIKRSSDNFLTSIDVGLLGGDRTCFGDCLGQVQFCSGTVRKKDNGTIVNNLGILKPSAGPSVVIQNQPTLELWHGTWVGVEGHDQDPLVTPTPPHPPEDIQSLIWTDSTTLRAILRQTYSSPIDSLNIDTGKADDSSTDTFSFLIQSNDISNFTRVRIEIQLDDDPTTAENYYWADFPVDIASGGGLFTLGLNAQTHIAIPRSQFTRAGNDLTVDWTHVTAINFIATALSDTWVLFGEQKFVGGAKGQLSGFYQYAQVDINDNGTYIGQSPLVLSDDNFYVNNGYTTITPNAPTDTQVTGHWIYRRSVITQQGTLANTPLLLNKWYKVLELNLNTAGDDTLSDLNAIETNEVANEFLQSVQDVPESIVGMEGLFNERMLYLTPNQLLLSDRLNPDAIDTRYSIRASGDKTEKNLWIKKITNNLLVLATTKDLYAISGTLLDQPDGSIDAQVNGLGESYPPLSDDVAGTEGTLFYISANGLRATSGSNSIPLSGQLDLLFQGLTRAGIAPVSIAPNNQLRYQIAVGRSHIYFNLPLQDGSQILIAYSLKTQIFRFQTQQISAIHVTQKDEILLGYAGIGQRFLRLFETGTTIDGTDGQAIEFRTVFDSNNQPRNRKDTFTLKIIADTGNQPCTVYVAKDEGAFTSVGTLQCNGEGTNYFSLPSITLGFRYAIKIIGNNLTAFRLFEVTIEYDPRPEQVNYLRIQNTNQGSFARKRWTSFAFVIDTLGHTVSFTPYIDNAAGSPGTFQTPVKLTHIHFFTAETIGTDLGGILSTEDGSPFEFYGVNLDETVSEKLPTPTEFLIIPANDFGNPNRKRHTSYKFQINTRGQDVIFTPRIDGTNYTPTIVNTNEKRTVEHFFDVDVNVIGIDIGGKLDGSGHPFEFYGVIVPQQLEVLPARLMSYYPNTTNFGSTSRKRVRTIPIIIDTGGQNVEYIPEVDGTNPGPVTIFNTDRKRTVYHFFNTDVFGIDYGGAFKALTATAFEFYGFGEPEEVEVLPAPKIYDQLTPLRFDKIGKLFAFRVRLISMGGTTNSIPFRIVGDDQITNYNYDSEGEIYSSSFPVIPFKDNVYEVKLPKNVNGTIMRIILGPTTDPFHRYDLQAKVSMSGMESDSRWVQVR